MAIIQNPIIGRAKNQAGNMVFTTIYGQNVLKAKPISVRNPNTDLQQHSRGIMTSAVQVAKRLRLIEGVAKRSSRTGRNPKMSAYSYIVKSILANCSGQGLLRKINMAGIDLGPGDIPPTTISLEYNSNTLLISWPITDLASSQLGTDIPILAVADFATGNVTSSELSNDRSEGGINIENFKTMYSDLTQVAIFIFFKNVAGTKWSTELSFGAPV